MRKMPEISQSMKDEPFKTCPESACRMKKWGKGKVRRQIGTGAGLIFKGSGFYITDYRSEGYKQEAKKDSAPETPKADTKPDSKPAAEKPKPDSKPAAEKPKPATKAPPSKKTE